MRPYPPEPLREWVNRCNAPGADVGALVRERHDTLESLTREVIAAAAPNLCSVLAETRWFKRAAKVLTTAPHGCDR